MSNPPQLLIVVSLFLLATHPATAEELQCKYEQQFKDGSAKGVDVQLGIVSGKIEKLVVASSNSSGREGGGHVCRIDTSEKHLKYKWSTNNKKTVLAVVYEDTPDGESIIGIEPIGNTYKINLEDASRASCGFGAEWPQYVVIQPGNKKCRVVD